MAPRATASVSGPRGHRLAIGGRLPKPSTDRRPFRVATADGAQAETDRRRRSSRSRGGRARAARRRTPPSEHDGQPGTVVGPTNGSGGEADSAALREEAGGVPRVELASRVDTRHTPVQDADWALDRTGERLGTPLPACLVGHSLGGRAALLAAVRREVQSVVALAPGVYRNDVAQGIAGKRILIVHGSADRVASPARSAALADTLSRQAAVTYITINGGKHAMLGRHALFDQLAAQFAVWTLLGKPTSQTISRIETGERRIQIEDRQPARAPACASRPPRRKTRSPD